MTAASTMAASTGCGRFRSNPDAKSTTISVKTAATRPDTGVRAPALSLTSDCDMPPLTGNPRPSPASEIAGAKRQKLLIRVEPIAVLLAEHPADGRRLHGAEDEARQRDRQKLVQILPAHHRQPERRQALRNLSQQRHALCLEVHESSREHTGQHHEKRNRPVLQPELAGDERRQGGDSHEQRHTVRVAQMCDEVRRALPEVAVRALESEELWKLRARQIERQPRFEAHEHGFGEEADRIAGADQPRSKRDECDE